MYVVRVFQGAVCFKKDTYPDWACALRAFSDLPECIFTHITLEIYREFSTETWVRFWPFPTNMEEVLKTEQASKKEVSKET